MQGRQCGHTMVSRHHMEKSMKRNPQPKAPQRQVLVVLMTAALSLSAAVPLRAATPEPATAPVATAPDTKPAQQCLTDLSALQDQMRKDGYWRGVSGFGYGYPMYGYDYDGSMSSPAMGSAKEPGAARYWRARPGYEVRTLFAATQILAQRGEQASCAALLGETRKIYDVYAAEVRSGHVFTNNVASYRESELAAAKPVAGQDVSYRSDQLIGTEVSNPKGEQLGSVDDLVQHPVIIFH